MSNSDVYMIVGLVVTIIGSIIIFIPDIKEHIRQFKDKEISLNLFITLLSIRILGILFSQFVCIILIMVIGKKFFGLDL